MHRHPRQSNADIARALDWFMSDGEPYRQRVFKAMGRLKSAKLVRTYRGEEVLTENGQKAAKKAADEAEDEQMRMDYNARRYPDN
jgi:hypothetical protein